MELIGRISKGSKMDQVYLPKNRAGLSSGEYVLIMPLDRKIGEAGGKTRQFKPYFYNTKNLEPIKLGIIEEIFKILEKLSPENVIITGSFLERGFKFNDLDILIINGNRNTEQARNQIESITGIKAHIIPLDNRELAAGLSSDPLYLLMLSKCVSKNRLIFNVKRKINYKILDLHLLKSKTLIDNFDILSGSEKYYSVLNMISILLFVRGKKLSKEIVNKEIEGVFGIKTENIRENMINKQDFIKRYKRTYDQTFDLIMRSIKHEK